MDLFCDNQKLIRIIILFFKYLLPILLILHGITKLFISKKKKKQTKKLFIKIILAIVIFLLSLGIETILKNKYECIKCIMEKNCEIKVNNENKVEQPKEKPVPDQPKEEPVSEPSKEELKPEIIEDGNVTYIDGILIVNKTYSLPESYMPANAQGYNRCNECLTQETMAAFKEMKADAQVVGLNLYLSSGYRSYSYQKGLYNNYVSRDGKVAADTYSARPGHSEHQTGLAFDLNTIDDSFANTEEGKWVQDNCHRYGLILRYPKGKEEITGYKYESWHLRYVGKELAQKLYNDGNWITLEEHFGITSQYE